MAPGRQGLVQVLLHAIDLARGGGAVELAHDADAQGGMADQERGVDGGGCGLQRRHIVGEAREAVGLGAAQEIERGRRC
jgi:hypothetical protein